MGDLVVLNRRNDFFVRQFVQVVVVPESLLQAALEYILCQPAILDRGTEKRFLYRMAATREIEAIVFQALYLHVVVSGLDEVRLVLAERRILRCQAFPLLVESGGGGLETL